MIQAFLITRALLADYNITECYYHGGAQQALKLSRRQRAMGGQQHRVGLTHRKHAQLLGIAQAASRPLGAIGLSER